MFNKEILYWTKSSGIFGYTNMHDVSEATNCVSQKTRKKGTHTHTHKDIFAKV